MRRISAIAVLALAACSTTDIQTVASDVPTACALARQAVTEGQSLLSGGALNTVNSLAPFVDGGCDAAEAIAKLSQDPSSVQWLNGITAQINQLLGKSS